MPLVHKFISQKSDSSDPTLVNASNWNAVHAGTLDTLALSVYSCSGSVLVATGPSGNCIILACPTASGTTITVTLPPASGAVVKGTGNNQVSGYKCFVMNTGPGIVKVVTVGLDYINLNAQTYELDNQFQFVELTPDGGATWGGYGWWITDQS